MKHLKKKIIIKAKFFFLVVFSKVAFLCIFFNFYVTNCLIIESIALIIICNFVEDSKSIRKLINFIFLFYMPMPILYGQKDDPKFLL